MIDTKAIRATIAESGWDTLFFTTTKADMLEMCDEIDRLNEKVAAQENEIHSLRKIMASSIILPLDRNNNQYGR